MQRDGFKFGNDTVKEAKQDKNDPLDAYDRARMNINMIHKHIDSGRLKEAEIINFQCTVALTEALLAVADAIYVNQGLSRVPTKGK